MATPQLYLLECLSVSSCPGSIRHCVCLFIFNIMTWFQERVQAAWKGACTLSSKFQKSQGKGKAFHSISQTSLFLQNSVKLPTELIETILRLCRLALWWELTLGNREWNSACLHSLMWTAKIEATEKNHYLTSTTFWKMTLMIFCMVMSIKVHMWNSFPLSFSRLKCPYETAVELAALCLQGTFFSGN